MMFAEVHLDQPRPWPCAACCNASPQDSNRRCPDRGNVFLVEFRDEVYARLAADLKERGLRVVRGRAAATSPRRVEQCQWELVLINLEAPRFDAWSVVERCRQVRPNARIWVYSARLLPIDRVIAEWAGADAMIEYRGDPIRLSEAIRGRLGSLPARLPARASSNERPHFLANEVRTADAGHAPRTA